MTTDVGVGGTYKDVAAISVGVGGAWKSVTAAHVGVGGVWKSVFQSGTVALDATYSVSAIALAEFSIESDGDISRESDGGGVEDLGDWITPKAAASGSYEVRATLQSGDTPTGTLGSWTAISSTQSWSLSGETPGSCDILIEIRFNGGAALDSSVVTLAVTT